MSTSATHVHSKLVGVQRFVLGVTSFVERLRHVTEIRRIMRMTYNVLCVRINNFSACILVWKVCLHVCIYILYIHVLAHTLCSTPLVV